MIPLDPFLAAAAGQARDEYLATLDLRAAAEARRLLSIALGPDGIMVPAGVPDAPILERHFRGIADAADRLATDIVSTADELALRRAGAHLRQAAALLVAGAPTQRIPVISDELAAARLRAGKSRDTEPPPLGPPPPVVIVDAAPVAPIDDEATVPSDWIDLGGES